MNNLKGEVVGGSDGDAPDSKMNLEGEDLVLKPLLLIGGRSSRMGIRKELLPFPDGRLAFEHALETLYSSIPTTSTINISLRDQTQLPAIQFRIDDLLPALKSGATHGHDHDHKPKSPPKLVPVYDQEKDIGPAAGLLAAYATDPEATWLVLGCDYPLLPPTALQQLILEYESPVTCFLNDGGFAEPLISIWGPEALAKLKENILEGRRGLDGVIKDVGGKLVVPLREEWIMGTNTREEWDEAMSVVRKSDEGRVTL